MVGVRSISEEAVEIVSVGWVVIEAVVRVIEGGVVPYAAVLVSEMTGSALRTETMGATSQAML